VFDRCDLQRLETVGKIYLDLSRPGASSKSKTVLS